MSRVHRWCAGFGERHGEPVVVTLDGPALRLRALDGATAFLTAPFPPSGGEAAPGLDALVSSLLAHRRCAVLLVRRGGYACAVVDLADGRGTVTTSKTGSRYVQSRTAAGGWSQQRFARRREGQARDLVGAVSDVAARILLPALSPARPSGRPPVPLSAGPSGEPAAGPSGEPAAGPSGGPVAGAPCWLVTGGDRPLVDAVLADPRLRPLFALPVGPHLAIGDPRADVVKALPQRLTSARITITDPPGPS
ncbi:MAG: hypothetical protein QG622_713 [Actinomycetota bacterium]|nr:hypothetical protein [Actinomycetota bacterium]